MKVLSHLNMVKITDLMIGDLVYNAQKEPCRVMSIIGISIEGSYVILDNLSRNDGTFESTNQVSGIKITPEILEKNGLKSIYYDEKSAYKWQEYDADDNYQSVVIDFRVRRASEVWNEKGKKSYKGKILCLHELQHIMKICEISKNIEL